MPVNSGKEWTFNTVADTYGKIRPGYPDELYLEDAAIPDDSFDLVYSASAFHWVPEEIGYPKVFRILKSGGAFARFANHPYRAGDNPELFEAINRVYAEHYYTYYTGKKQPDQYPVYSEEQAAERARIADRYGFRETRY